MSAEEPLEEMSFRFDELFFSRTESHGIIQSGNAVFQRVSGYSWDELIGKAHKLVRHPDMPRAVFYILWDRIKRGKPVGAYVKNRTKDGRHYWVFAVVTPIDGGFLSVRLKPSTALFATVQKEYEALRHIEIEQKPMAADSAAALVERLQALGYADYETFMSEALASEVTARDAALNRASDVRIQRFADVLASARNLLSEAAVVSAGYAKNERVSLNFQVQAAKLGETGAVTGQISKNYDLICAQINTSLEKFTTSAQQVFATVSTAQFLTCTALVQKEVHDLFRRETESGASRNSEEIPRLEHQLKAYQQLAVDGLQDIAERSTRFRRQCEDMKRMAGALEVTRIMGMVECARQKLVGESLGELLAELETLQVAVTEGLAAIDRANQRIKNGTEGLISHARWLARAA
jgi:aerotaxis receptor